MFGEYRRYHEYKPLFQEHGLLMMPLHTLALEREGVRDVQYKISQIKRLRDEQLPEWRGKVPGETLDLLSDRLKEYLQEADSRLNEVKHNFEHDDLLVSLLTDYRLYDLNFLVFHPRNKMVG